jgi:hypothetical protein
MAPAISIMLLRLFPCWPRARWARLPRVWIPHRFTRNVPENSSQDQTQAQYLVTGSHRKSRFQVHPRASRTTKKLCFRGLVGLEWSCEASLSRRRNLPQYHHAKLHTIASNFLIVVVDWDLLNAPQFGLNSPCRPPAHWLPERAPCPSTTSTSHFRR